MSKKGRSLRGLHYGERDRDASSRLQMIVDEIIDHNHPDRIKLRNGGGHQYQRRHLDLITYQVQYAIELVPAWRSPQWQRPYETDMAYYKNREGIISDIRRLDYTWLLGGDYVDGSAFKEVRPLEIRDGVTGWINDLHIGTHSPGSESDFFMEALGHRPALLNPYPQLTLADLASGVHTKVLEHSDTIMKRVSMQARSSGKSMSINTAFMEAYQTRRWFDENLKFSLHPHQKSAVEQLNKAMLQGHGFYL